jgi:hypothetical protein
MSTYARLFREARQTPQASAFAEITAQEITFNERSAQLVLAYDVTERRILPFSSPVESKQNSFSQK